MAARNTPRRNPATARHPGTHRARISPLPVARERISRRSCRNWPLKDASRRSIAIGKPSGMRHGNILPWPPPSRMHLSDISPRTPSATWACSSRRREHAGKTSCNADNGKASNPPSGDGTVRPAQGLGLDHKRILQRNRRRRRGGREAPCERNVDQFNNVRRPVQETVKIFWCLPPRNCAENMLAYHGEHERKRYLHQQHQ